MALRRTVIQIEVLYDSDQMGFPGDMRLTDLAYQIVEGCASGNSEVISDEEVSRERMADLLVAQGSDPEFLLGEDKENEEN